MTGSVYKYKLPNGRAAWRYQVDAGRDEQGKRVRITESGFRYEREARAAMQRRIEQLQRGSGAVSTRTLGDYLEWWLPWHAETKPLAPKTAERYRSLAAHVIAALGRVPLAELTTVQLDDLYVRLRRRLSAKTVREVHNVVHVALKRAVKTKLIPANPADHCELPQLDQREMKALSPEQVHALQAAASGTWVDLIVRLASATGARRGEILALRWADIDWAQSRIRIERSLFQTRDRVDFKPTKTRQARVVALPASLLEYLRLHRQKQEEDRRLFGPDYRADLDLVFADPAGRPLLPSSVSRAVVRAARELGLKGVGLHSLRHSHASALLHAGVPITNVARRLGHRDTYTTARIYAHALPDTDQQVAQVWEKMLAEAAQTHPMAQHGTIREGSEEGSPAESVN